MKAQALTKAGFLVSFGDLAHHAIRHLAHQPKSQEFA